MRIVVADDDAITTLMLEAYLLQLGHEVAVAPDGCAALELLQDNDYRVLITDWEIRTWMAWSFAGEFEIVAWGPMSM